MEEWQVVLTAEAAGGTEAQARRLGTVEVGEGHRQAGREGTERWVGGGTSSEAAAGTAGTRLAVEQPRPLQLLFWRRWVPSLRHGDW